MDTLEKRLLQLEINKILIADDTPENLAAARELEKLLPRIKFDFFASGKEITAAINRNPAAVDLVLTDLDMETPKAGLDVLQMAWELRIPALIISGGHKHHNQPIVKVVPASCSVGCGGKNSIGTEKNVTTTWVKALEMFVKSCASPNDVIYPLLLLRKEMKKTGNKPPLDGFIGGQIRKFAERQLSL